MGISWPYDIKIKRFKSPNSSIYAYRTTNLMKNPKWDKIVLKNIIANKLKLEPFSWQYSLLNFTLDTPMGISWAFDIKIKWFKSPNSSTHLGLQLLWRVWSEIKSFLKNRIWLQSGWSKRVSWSDSEIDNVEHPDITESMT